MRHDFAEFLNNVRVRTWRDHLTVPVDTAALVDEALGHAVGLRDTVAESKLPTNERPTSCRSSTTSGNRWLRRTRVMKRVLPKRPRWHLPPVGDVLRAVSNRGSGTLRGTSFCAVGTCGGMSAERSNRCAFPSHLPTLESPPDTLTAGASHGRSQPVSHARDDGVTHPANRVARADPVRQPRAGGDLPRQDDRQGDVDSPGSRSPRASPAARGLRRPARHDARRRRAAALEELAMHFMQAPQPTDAIAPVP
jgi:hypothetical protein